MSHKHLYHWSGELDWESMTYKAACECGKVVREVWVKSHYEDEEGNRLPDNVELSFE